MQTLNTLSTPEEKLAALCKKYAELVSSPRSPYTVSALESQHATQRGVEGTGADGWLNSRSTSLSLFLISLEGQVPASLFQADSKRRNFAFQW